MEADDEYNSVSIRLCTNHKYSLEFFLSIPSGDIEGSTCIQSLVEGNHTHVSTFHIFKCDLYHTFRVQL